MKTQQSFSDHDREHGKRKRTSRREVFLQKMGTLIPWHELAELITPHYYPANEAGRRAA